MKNIHNNSVFSLYSHLFKEYITKSSVKKCTFALLFKTHIKCRVKQKIFLY